MNNMTNTNNNCGQNGNNSLNESIRDNNIQNNSEQKNKETKRAKSFVLKTSLMECILMLPSHISCHVMKAVYCYKMTGEKPTFNEVENNDERITCNAFFLAILPQLGKPKRSEGKMETGKGSERKMEEENGSEEKREEKGSEEEPFGDGNDDFRQFFNKTVKDTGIPQLDFFNTQNSLYRQWKREYGKKGLAKAVHYCASHPRNRGEWVSIDWMLNTNIFPRIMRDELE
ncbi:MAG: hypothetical protein IKT00_02420 [Prevotella sp.]|nr:hypothetical protein [Prevotella sp.]